MQISDIYGALFGAVILGGFAFAVLAYALKASKRATVIRWCFLAGGVAIAIVLLCAILNIKPPAKISVGLVFVAFPALVCGLLLQLQNLISKAKNDKNQA
jgi:heme A synthase